MIQILELFGGIGAPRVALRNVGIPVKSIDYVEIDEKAVRSYNSMFESELPYKTQDVTGWNLKPDILVHGSPCQDFSFLGLKQGGEKDSGTRSSLMWETIHIIKQMGVWKPRIVIWENVRGVLAKRMIGTFNKYLQAMENLGYSNSFDVLDVFPDHNSTFPKINGLKNFSSKIHPLSRFLKSVALMRRRNPRFFSIGRIRPIWK